MTRDPDDEIDLASPKEAAHLRHREKKRVTEMVVDGAGVKRIAPILQEKTRSKKARKAK